MAPLLPTMTWSHGRSSLLLLPLLAALGSEGAKAQSCPSPTPSPPAVATRPYTDNAHQFSFQIPANYRAVGTSLGTVEFHDPASFAQLQCLINHRPLALRPTGTVLTVYPEILEVSPGLSDPDAIAGVLQQIQPWLVLYTPSYGNLTLGNRTGVTYRYYHQLYGTERAGATWLTGDREALVILEGPADSPVIQLLTTSLDQAMPGEEPPTGERPLTTPGP